MDRWGEASGHIAPPRQLELRREGAAGAQLLPEARAQAVQRVGDGAAGRAPGSCNGGILLFVVSGLVERVPDSTRSSGRPCLEGRCW